MTDSGNLDPETTWQSWEKYKQEEGRYLLTQKTLYFHWPLYLQNGGQQRSDQCNLEQNWTGDSAQHREGPDSQRPLSVKGPIWSSWGARDLMPLWHFSAERTQFNKQSLNSYWSQSTKINATTSTSSRKSQLRLEENTEAQMLQHKAMGADSAQASCREKEMNSKWRKAVASQGRLPSWAGWQTSVISGIW